MESRAAARQVLVLLIMAGEATVTDVLDALNVPQISSFVAPIFGGGSWPIAAVDLQIYPTGMSFLEQNIWSIFKEECKKWKKNGNRPDTG